MSFELFIRPEAEADARDAFGWYNEQLPGDASHLAEPEHLEPPARIARHEGRLIAAPSELN